MEFIREEVLDLDLLDNLVKTYLPVVLGFLLTGCYSTGRDEYEELLKHSSAEWSSRDRLTVIASVAQSNMQNKEANVFVTAIPYYPSVITAINRSVQAQKGLNEEEYVHNIALTLVDDTLSSLVRDHTQLLDDKGNYHKDLLDIDSLMFYVSMTNRTWPCTNPLIEVQGPSPNDRKMIPLFLQSVIPCPTFDISNLVANVYLVNDQDLHLLPKVIWGRRHETLTSSETLLMMFQFRSREYHFF